MKADGAADRARFWWIGAIGVALIAVLLAVWVLADRSGTEFTAAAVPLPAARQLQAGEMTTIELEVPHVIRLPYEGDPPQDVPPLSRLAETTRLHLVNHPELGMLALVDRSPWLGCRVVPITESELAATGRPAPPGFAAGFYDPCHGGLYDLDGRHRDGPGGRGLDRFPVTGSSGGEYTVDLTVLQAGPIG